MVPLFVVADDQLRPVVARASAAVAEGVDDVAMVDAPAVAPSTVLVPLASPAMPGRGNQHAKFREGDVVAVAATGESDVELRFVTHDVALSRRTLQVRELKADARWWTRKASSLSATCCV